MLQSRTFAGIATLLFIINLFIMNDVVAYWSPVELDILTKNGASSPLIHAIASISEGNEFTVRLVSSLFIIGGLLALFYFGQALFGKKDMMVASVFTMSSLLLPQLGKTLSGDAALFLCQALIFISNILYIKRPKKVWLFTYGISFFAALLLHFIPALLFASILWLFLYFKHPQGKNSTKLMPWASVLLAVAVLYGGAYPFLPDGFWLDFSVLPFGKYLLIIILGVVPFLPFAVAGLKHNILKFRKKEELSIILLALLAASLIAYSLMFQFVLALMAAKQIKDYEKSYYNHKKTVKLVSVLLLITSFFTLAALMIYAFEYLREPGFRAAILLAAVFWVFNFISVIGIYGNRISYAYGGMVLSGLLFTFFAWTQLIPIYESKAAVAKQLIYKIQKEKATTVATEEAIRSNAFDYYAQQNNINIVKSNLVDSTDIETIFIGLNKDKTIIANLRAWHSMGVDTSYYLSKNTRD